MEFWTQYWEFLLFPVIGAIIGVVTNDIAIRMLFRPYEEKRVGPWRVPFTPGLIPAQRHVIANNIAETFEAKLLSTREIHAFFTGEIVRAKVSSKVDQMVVGLGPLGAMANSFKPMIVEKLLHGIEEMAEEAVSDGSSFDVKQRIVDRIDSMEIAHLEDLILGFSRKQFRHITFFGGVLGFLIGMVQAGLSYGFRGGF
jgi:uncharacterized membrane protein YheB (UPF0754 family)